jgi:methylthioribose-1-phosphate isomerase
MLNQLMNYKIGNQIDNIQVFGLFRVIEYAENLFNTDRQINRRIGDNGAESVLSINPGTNKLSIITICNTGSLATSGYGTALGLYYLMLLNLYVANRCYS